MKLAKLLSMEEKFHAKSRGGGRKDKACEKSKRRQKKRNGRQTNLPRRSVQEDRRNKAIDEWEDAVGDDDVDFLDFDYDYAERDYDYRGNYEGRWYSNRRSHAFVDTAQVRECGVCCEEMLDADTVLFERSDVDAAVSFRDAVLAPRPPQPRDVSHLPKRALIGGENGCCAPCILRTIQAALGNGAQRDEVACPRCGVPITAEECVAFLRSDQVSAEAAAPLLAKFDAMMVRRVALENAGKDVSFVTCAGPNCGLEFLFNWNTTCSLVVCRECDFANCVVCKGAYHFGKTCKQVIDASSSLMWRHDNTRACPRCHVSIEKNGGCSHHYCTRCGLDYNWEGAPKGIFGLEQMTRAMKFRHKRRKNPRSSATMSEWSCSIESTTSTPTPVVDQPVWMRSIRI